LGFEVYSFSEHRRMYLMFSADPTQARVQLLGDKLRRGVETPSPLGLLLRRNVEEARLITVRQPPYERVMEFEINGAAGQFTLIVEPMERRANILLVKDGKILDCLRRVGPTENRVRLSLPGHEYLPPPRQITKHSPESLTIESVKTALTTDPTRSAWRALTDTFLGYSPTLAKETIYRAAGRWDAKSNATDAADLFEVMREMLDALLTGRYEPGICEEDGVLTAFTSYELTYLKGWRAVDSGQISEALNLYYGAPSGIDAYDAAKQPIFTLIADATHKIERKLEGLRRSVTDDSQRERLRQSGELLLAYQYQILPGQTTFSAEYDLDQPPLIIALDPKLTALENAKRYFADYDHAKRAMAEVPALIEATEQESAYLTQLKTDLALAANWPEIGEVQDALHSGGYWQGAKVTRPKGVKTSALRVVTSEGIVIWVGRNARQNEDVTFTKGRPEDIWLHARGIAGAHVIIKSSGRPLPSGVLQRAAGLAAYYSASRGERRVLVDVTERRHVRKIKGGKPGMVTYRNETVMEVTPTPD
jgi:predicted ribosome quality control (RQC) complex YloA/Tae2 family protein